MNTFLALLPNPIARCRLQVAVRWTSAQHSGAGVLFADGWRELRALALKSTATVVYVDPYSSGKLNIETLEAFLHDFPNHAIVPYADFRRHPAMDVIHIAEHGIHEVITLHQDDDPASLQESLSRIRSSGVVVDVMEGLADAVDPNLVPLLRRILFESRGPLTPGQVAESCFRHPKTVREQLRRSGLPSTNRLIGWARLLHASRLLEDGTRSVDGTALALGFASGGALRAQLRRYTGLRPHQLARPGGFSSVLERFRQQLRSPE